MKQNASHPQSTPGTTVRKSYPSDISREEFAPIKPLLESARRRTAPRRVDLYDIFCAMLYVLRNGCTWRSLPGDFPKWCTVYSYFSRWKEEREEGNLLGQALKKCGIQIPPENWPQRTRLTADC